MLERFEDDFVNHDTETTINRLHVDADENYASLLQTIQKDNSKSSALKLPDLFIDFKNDQHSSAQSLQDVLSIDNTPSDRPEDQISFEWSTEVRPPAFKLFDQHEVASDPNACGTTSLAMILANRGKIENTIDAARQVDRSIRVAGFFSHPNWLESAARDKGLSANQSNECKFEDLSAATRKGPVMVLIDGPHYVVVNEVKTVRKENGEEEVRVVIADPADGKLSEIPKTEFEKRWANPLKDLPVNLPGNFDFGYQNWMMTFDGQSYGKGDNVGISNNPAVSTLVHDGLRIAAASRDLVKGANTITGGALEMPATIVGGVRRVATAAIPDEAKDMLSSTAGAIRDTARDVVNSIGDAIGDLWS